MDKINPTTSLDELYNAAHEEAVLVDRSVLGLLQFSGETRLDLINRMSTQKVVDLKAGQGAATILTSDIGRIIDRLILYVSEDQVICLTSQNNGQNIAQYLMRFVFFMDDFHITDLSDERIIFGVYGHKAEKYLSSLFEMPKDLPLHHWIESAVGDIDVTVHRTDPIAGDSFLVMASSADKEPVRKALLAGGLVAANSEAFEYLRIENGIPHFGRELSLDYIPLEAGLWDDVSFNKGCYTGQEIIARMESRGRLAKKLVTLKLDALVEPGSPLTSGGKGAGAVTSAAAGPAGVLALGYVKTSALEAGEPLTAGSTAARLI